MLRSVHHRLLRNSFKVQQIIKHRNYAIKVVSDFVDKVRFQMEANSDTELDVWTQPMLQELPNQSPKTNWTLADYGITPTYDAYRNASLKHLLERVYGKVDENGVVHVPHFETKYDKYLFKDLNRRSVYNNFKEFSPLFAKRFHREITYYFTHVGESFLHDGDMGAHRDSIRMRVVTDNAVTALCLRNMMLPMWKNMNPLYYENDAIIMFGPGYKFLPKEHIEEFNGPYPKDLGIEKEENLVVFDPLNTIVTTAISDTKVLLDSLVYMAGRTAVQRLDELIIPSDSIVNKNGQVTLIINNENDEANIRRNEDELYGAHHNLWKNGGLTRVWGGVHFNCKQVPKQLEKGSLVEEIEKGQYRVYKQLKGIRPNLVHHPKNVVIMIHDPSNVIPALAKISTKSAVDLFTCGLVNLEQFAPGYYKSENYPSFEHPAILGDLFAKLLNESKAQVFIVNSAADANKAIQIIHSGEASKLNGTETPGSNGEWITLSHESLKQQQTEEQEKGIRELFERIQNYLDTLPPKHEVYRQPRPKQWWL